MARITVEDCLNKQKNRFELVGLCSKRVRQVLNGAETLVKTNNKQVVNSLREIAAGLVRFMNEDDYKKIQAEQEKKEQEALDQAEKQAETQVASEEVSETLSETDETSTASTTV
ncbi:UNVERIFIED_CONTAM: hypothetical protein GTU68_066727 [Idotea baltica]|nr:hypothetical protein [Idotea baltica]